MTQRPSEKSLGAFSGSRLVGVAIPGPSIGLPQAASCWVFTDSAEAFSCLLNQLRQARVGSLSFPLPYMDCVARHNDVSIDRFYVMGQSQIKTKLGASEVEHLSRRRFENLTIPDEMTRLVGCIDSIPEGFPYYGIVRKNEIVALAETGVRDTEVAAIQQVFTLSSARGQGFGRTVVEYVALDLLKDGLLPTYFTAELNRESVSLAESAGFELDSRWGYTDLN
ncbi:MAG: GNAT family N-acetyltransferase [Candidatus Sabulitectum sp.]|nr:GNAT family N-acetyltransferase [Candidatus Sabulitectum sp.]